MYKIRSLFIILLIIVLSGCNTFDKKKQIADDVFLNIEEMVTHLTIDLIKTAKDSVKIFQNAERLTDGLFPDAEYEFYDKTFKWTPPYVDTTGKGFIVDILYPVYNQNFMEAFIGLDITISTLKEQFFDNLNEKMLLIDKKTSQIIAISDYAIDLLGVENIEAFRYLEMIDNTEIAKQVMPDNLVLNKTNSLHMQELWNKIDDSEESIITIKNKEHRIYRKIIDDPQWYLVIIE